MSSSHPPIIFVARGMELDTRLQVFNQAFLVHSAILKQHSAFFSTFLNSPDKEFLPQRVSTSFKYEWISKVDEDGSWSLVSANSINVDESRVQPALQGSRIRHTKTFHAMLCAFYGMKYDLDHTTDIFSLTEMADYYCALPCISSTLSSALMRHPPATIKDLNWVTLLDAALRLRHRELFSDCIVMIAGCWDDREYEEYLEAMSDPVLLSLVKRVRGIIALKVAEVFAQFVVDHQSSEPLQKAINKHSVDYSGKLPYYLRQAASVRINGYFGEELFGALTPLVVNRLYFKAREHVCNGCEDYYLNSHFVGEIVEEADLPWDVEQKDW